MFETGDDSIFAYGSRLDKSFFVLHIFLFEAHFIFVLCGR